MPLVRPRTTRARRSRPAAAVTALAALLLTSVATTVPSTASAAEPTTHLDVTFSGAFSSGDSYTAATGETMSGELRRRTGAESLEFGTGVVLGGGQEGVELTPADLPLGTTTLDTALVVETVFTPAAAQGSLATVVGVGGNLFARYESGRLRYGFEHDAGTAWTAYAATTDVPSAGEAHALALAYVPLPGGGATLRAFLDGSELAPVTAAGGRATLNPARSGDVAYGNDVHPQALVRGLVGSVGAARLATFDGEFDTALLAHQDVLQVTDVLDVGFAGTFDGAAYVPADGETVAGTVERRAGTETVGASGLALGGGTQGAHLLAPDVALGTTRADVPFVVETRFTPGASQVAMGTLLAVGGNFSARYQDGRLRYGFDSDATGSWASHVATVDVPAAGAEHVLSLVYVPDAASGASVYAFLDEEQLPTVTATTGRANLASGTRGIVGVGNDVHAAALGRGFAGTVTAARFATFSGAFSTDVVAYQDVTLAPPPPCDPAEVDPADRIEVTPGECAESVLAKASALRPTERQLSWQEAERTAFLHFGVNTFTGQEWGYGDEDPDLFQPTALDTDQWARTLRDNGFRIAILTVKHHDGFTLYPSRYTEHDVASSSWRDGRGDVLRDFTESARRYGLRVGVYLSPADENQFHQGVFANGSPKTPRSVPTLVEGDDRAGQDLPTFSYDATDYGAFFLNQLYEVLTQYGEIDEVWFDGAQGRIPAGYHEDYDFPAYYDLIRELMPDATIAVTGPDVRWVGNEGGLARENEWSTVPVSTGSDGRPNVLPGASAPDLGSDAALAAAVASGGASALAWWPAEVDVSIRDGWFHHANQAPKSVAQLRNIYYQSVGRNSVLLLNVPPDTDGRLPQADVARLAEWNARLRQDMPVDLAVGADAVADGSPADAVVDGDLRTGVALPADGTGSVEIDLGGALTVDRVALSEDIADAGQQVRAFAVDAKVDGAWRQVAASGTVGHRKIVALGSPVTTSEVRVRVTSARGETVLSGVSLYGASGTAVAAPTEYYLDCSADRPGTGTQDDPMRTLGQLRSVDLPPGATVHVRAGTTCAEPLELWGYGTDSAPARLVAWGDGAAPVLAAPGNAAAVARLAEQGWEVDGVVVADEVPADDVDVEVSATTRSLAGSPYVAVRALNGEDVPADVEIVTPYGSRTFTGVAPGASAYVAFNARGPVTAGEATVSVTVVRDGHVRTVTRAAAYGSS